MDGPSVNGVDQLLASYERMERKVARKITARAVRTGAKVLLQATKNMIPRVATDQHPAGELARQLKIRSVKSKIKGRVAVKVAATFNNAAAFNAALVEFGHKGPYGSAKSTPGHPYLRRAFDAVASAAGAAVEATLTAGIQAVIQES